MYFISSYLLCRKDTIMKRVAIQMTYSIQSFNVSHRPLLYECI